MTDHRRAHVLIGGGTGAVDKIDGAGLAAGDTIQCINSEGIYHYVNIQDSAAENSPYVIRPDTNPGTNSWHLVVPQGPMSHVEANRTAVQSIGAAAWETFIFSTEVEDDLGEHNNTTGIFTAIYAGKYLINAMVSGESVSYASGEELAIGIAIDSDTITYSGERQAFTSTYPGVFTRRITKSVKLTAGQTIKIVVLQTHASASNVGGNIIRNYMSIDRIM